jgi:hypothetical protein
MFNGDYDDFSAEIETTKRAKEIKDATDSQLRLMCGELTAQEIRSKT